MSERQVLRMCCADAPLEFCMLLAGRVHSTAVAGLPCPVLHRFHVALCCSCLVSMHGRALADV